MRKRLLSDDEQREVADAVRDAMAIIYPGRHVDIVVLPETDEKGVPQYEVHIRPMSWQPQPQPQEQQVQQQSTRKDEPEA